MYRDGKEYDEMATIVIQIYIDYDIREFPINAEIVCRKMGIALVKYGEFPEEGRNLLKKQSKSSFYLPPSSKNSPAIFYNNNVLEAESEGNIRRNIFHEVKHYVCEDPADDPDDDLADYFGKYFLAPIPYLIAKNIFNKNEIMSHFGVDYTMASFIQKNLRKRKNKYHNRIFEYEKPLLRHLLGEDYGLLIDDEKSEVR